MPQTPNYVPGSPRIAHVIAGSGPPVVFLHGIGGRRQNWQQQIDAIAGEFTAVAWDARGYGDSEDYPGRLKFSAFSDDLARLLDHLNVEQAHLVGLSMGARILMDFYPRHTARVASLVLCDCFYAFATALSKAQQDEFIELRERPLREGKTFADLAPNLIDSLVSANCPGEVRQQLRESILALRTESYLKTLRASLSFDRAAALADITAPVQLIFGAEDRLTPPALGEEMLTILPNASLAIVAGAGHLSNLEQPQRFNQILIEFLKAQTALSPS